MVQLVIGMSSPQVSSGLMSANGRGRWGGFLGVLLAVTAWCAMPCSAPAQLVLQRIYTSAASSSVSPFSELVQLPDGNFYGTRLGSGPGAGGSVVRLTSAGALTTLVAFTGFNGSDPEGGLVAARDGNLYGTTASGGIFNLGTIFRITAAGAFQSLHSFAGTDGAGPFCTLIQASDGNLYGVKVGGGLTNAPGIFRATTTGAVTTLTNFQLLGGFTPNDGLVEGPDGWLYGTLIYNGPQSKGYPVGSIFKISTNGDFKTLDSFTDLPPLNGIRPMAGLTVGPDGFLYGTLGHDDSLPATTNNGSVFRITTNGDFTIIASFAGTNGSNPMTRLALGQDGAFYGLTVSGGPNNQGTIFRVTTNGGLTALTGAFGSYGVQSGSPPLTLARDGNWYGTGQVAAGGTGSAIAFRLVQPPLMTASLGSSGNLTLTWTSFTGGVYRVACKNSLEDPGWTTLIGSVTAAASSTSISNSIAGTPARWYQVVLLP